MRVRLRQDKNKSLFYYCLVDHHPFSLTKRYKPLGKNYICSELELLNFKMVLCFSFSYCKLLILLLINVTVLRSFFKYFINPNV